MLYLYNAQRGSDVYHSLVDVVQKLIEGGLRARIDRAVLRRAEYRDDHIEISVDDAAFDVERLHHGILAPALQTVKLFDLRVHLGKERNVPARKQLFHRLVERKERRDELLMCFA